MCSNCTDILEDFGIQHTIALCPLRNSWYCSYCAIYGHLTKSCPAKPSILFIKPAYIEQLIPYSDLKEYNITSKTPIITPLIEKKEKEKEKEQRLLEIKDNDKVIAAYLGARSVKIQRGFTKRQTLEEYAKLENKRVVYIH
jgi:hypothetical protein